MATTSLIRAGRINPAQFEDASDERPRQAYFGHTPLAHPTDQIRLLTCGKTGVIEDHLTLEIETFGLVEAPPYAAVSYLWGAPGDPRCLISLNGQPYAVQENLESFLAHFDHSQWKIAPPTRCWLWIDALSIDQRSVSEKNAQVPLMGRIFQQASCVFAWLGHHMEDASHSIEHGTLEDQVIELTDVGQHKGGFQRLHKPLCTTRFDTPGISWADVHLRDTTDPEINEWRRGAWYKFAKICENALWRRVWIRQEIWLAADIVLCCSKASIAWRDFEAVFDNLRSHTRKYQNHHHVYYPAWVIAHDTAADVVMRRTLLRKDLTTGQPFARFAPLRVLIEACKDLQSTLSHDYVYGLLGLAMDCQFLPVEYTKSVGEVYLDVLAVTQHVDDLINWNRTLLDHLRMSRASKDVGEVVKKKAEQGEQWHLTCVGMGLSHVLDATHDWNRTIDLLRSGEALVWEGTLEGNPPEWDAAWERHHGKLHPISSRPERLSGAWDKGLRHLNELNVSSLLAWTIATNYACYEARSSENLEAEDESAADAMRSAITNAPVSSAHHPWELEENTGSVSSYQRPKLILGARGEIGVASQSARAGDLIVEVVNSHFIQDPPIYLLARRRDKIFDIVGRVFFRQHGEAFMRKVGDQVSLYSNVDEEDFGPVEELTLYLDIRTLYRLSVITLQRRY